MKTLTAFGPMAMSVAGHAAAFFVASSRMATMRIRARAGEVYRECRERIDVFGAGGGFVFDAVRNVQATTPTPNLLALFKALSDSNR